jgi:hypothetical protein
MKPSGFMGLISRFHVIVYAPTFIILGSRGYPTKSVFRAVYANKCMFTCGKLKYANL